MTNTQLNTFTHALLDASRKYLKQADPLGESDNYVCHMTTSMVLAGIADALIDFQNKEIEES